MGVDVRDFESTEFDNVQAAIRAAGFDVEESGVESDPAVQAGVQVRRLLCRRQRNVIALHFVIRDPGRFVNRVYIPNLSSCWPPTHRRKKSIQDDVTRVLESCGARFPWQTRTESPDSPND